MKKKRKRGYQACPSPRKEAKRRRPPSGGSNVRRPMPVVDVVTWILSKEGQAQLKKTADEVSATEAELRRLSYVSDEDMRKPMTI